MQKLINFTDQQSKKLEQKNLILDINNIANSKSSTKAEISKYIKLKAIILKKYLKKSIVLLEKLL